MTTSAANKLRCFVWMGLGLLLGLPLLMVACRPSIEIGIVKFSGLTMGTHYRVSLAAQAASSEWPPDTSDLEQLVNGELERINQLMSTYEPDSELSKFNRSQSAGWFPVSADTAKVVTYALDLAKETDGAYNPLVGPIVNLWGFGPDKREHLPTDSELAELLPLVDYQSLEVRESPPALLKTMPEAYLDLSSIAKGYAVDKIVELLEKYGFQSLMVDIGGEVRTLGEKPGGDPWRIAIENPASDAEPFQKVLVLSNAAVATSGDYRNFFEQDGVRYSHTINPETGKPVEHSTAVVSVQAETCMEADALATALLVMGAERGYDWCKEHRIAALFQIRQDEGITVRTTPEFDLLHPPSNSKNN